MPLQQKKIGIVLILILIILIAGGYLVKTGRVSLTGTDQGGPLTDKQKSEIDARLMATTTVDDKTKAEIDKRLRATTTVDVELTELEKDEINVRLRSN